MKHLLYIAGLASAVLMGPGPVHSQTLPSAQPHIERSAPQRTLPAVPPHITLSPPQLTLTHGPSCCYETRPGHFQTTVNTITVTNAGWGKARDVTLVVSHVTREGGTGPSIFPM